MRKKHQLAMPLFLATSILSGCSMSPPEAPVQKKLLTSQQVKLSSIEMNVIHEQWWAQFNDPQLTQLINLGFNNNLTLQQAQQKVELASQQIALAEAGNQVKVNLNISAGGFGTNAGSFNLDGAKYSGLGMLLPSFSYQFDFWGKHDAIIAAASNQKKSVQAKQEQAKQIIAASITNSYLYLQSSYQIEKNLNVLLNEIEQQNIVIIKQVKRGLAVPSDELLNQGDIDTLLAQISTEKTHQKLAKNQLALYLGTTPDQLISLVAPTAKPIKPLNSITAVPMSLLERRSDIIASKWLVEMSQQQVTQAKLAYYPDVNLMAVGVVQALTNLNPSRLLIGSATAGTNLPIYDGGVRDANYTSANIKFDSAVLDYNQTVLTAVKQASDAIINLQEAHRQLALSTSAVTHYQDAFELINKRYKRGLISFFEMNAARMLWHKQVIIEVNADAHVLQNQLQLISALGGSYTR
ncbi:hypothetical protein PCNPT3_06565 [Psychromonas sp. CNPT3]|uniref:efflux transporter outer membrane subunit n=1 Tax=Psychromonas sp. CNPT3 TaxID=314282 RepID=UPI00006E4838|nr:efflux transporter outer membrane subunit [Psychromonas sp. CNPT3]AGH81253.1 hypothetical protein PCNPT3_06565 [Psychromonas sp. CNPT3]